MGIFGCVSTMFFHSQWQTSSRSSRDFDPFVLYCTTVILILVRCYVLFPPHSRETYTVHNIMSNIYEKLKDASEAQRETGG